MHDAIEPPISAPAALAALVAMPVSWILVAFETSGFVLLVLSASARAVGLIRAAAEETRIGP